MSAPTVLVSPWWTAARDTPRCVEVYDDSPSRLDDPVDIDELSGLIRDEAKSFGRDHRRFLHFLQRLELSFRDHRRQMQLLHRDIQQANLRNASLGRPTTLDPATSAQYLPFEEVARQFDQHMHQRLAIQERIEQDAVAARAEAVRRVNAVKFVIETILDDPRVDDTTKTRIVSALSLLPEDPDAATGSTLPHAATVDAADAAPYSSSTDLGAEPSLSSGVGEHGDDLDELFG